MESTWQPLCFIRLQLLLIRLQRAPKGLFHSCPDPRPVLLVPGGCGCPGLCCCQWSCCGVSGLSVSLFITGCSLRAPQNPRSGPGVRLSSPRCSGEGSVTPRSSFPVRAQEHTELPPPSRRVLHRGWGLGPRHLIPLPPSQTKHSPSSSALGA